MLRHRFLLGTLLVLTVAALCWADTAGALGSPPGAWLFPLALLLGTLASGELLWLAARLEFQPIGWIVYVGNLAIVAGNAAPIFWPGGNATWPAGRFAVPAAALALATIAAMACQMWRYERTGRALVQVALTVFCLVYVGWMLTFAVQLRALGASGKGMLALVSYLGVVKMADTGAYTIGRLFGRRKMTPLLSPGKTWEGAAGGVVFGVAGAWVAFAVVRPWIDPISAGPASWRWIAYGVIVALAAMVGDLAESLIKREAGQKDSSGWMPGFGGVLDVIDSLLLAAPVAYLCWTVHLVY